MTSATVPMIAPNGDTGDIPRERAADAMKAGFKPAVVMTAPDGKTTGYIPQERAAEAVKSGFTAGQAISPDAAGLQPKDSAFFSDLRNTIKSAPEAAVKTLPGFQQYQQVKDAMADYDSIKRTGKTRAQLADDARKAAGYGAGYRALAPVAEKVGVNVSGMEQAAKEGDQAAVLGHAAAAAAPAVVAPLAGEIARVPAVGEAASAVADAAKTVPELAKNAAKTVINSKPVNFFADIENARTAGKVAGGVGGGVAGATHGPLGAVIGAERGAALGGRMGVGAAKVLAKLRDTLNAHAADIPENAATSAESNFAEAGSREPEVVHDEDPVTAAPAKVKAILDKAEADIKQVTAPKEQQPAAPGTREDKLDDRAITQEMGWDIAKHYYRGLAEQRDMAASSLSSKTELTTGAKVDSILAKAAEDARSVLQAAKIPSEGSKAAIAGRIPASWVKEGKIAVPQPGDDLVEVLQRSIDQVKARRGKTTVVKPTKGSVDGDGGAK